MPNRCKSITISFKPETLQLYNHVKQQDNKSAYILRLIRGDMKKRDEKTDLRAEVMRILDELKKTNQLGSNFHSNSEDSKLSEGDIDLINDFF